VKRVALLFCVCILAASCGSSSHATEAPTSAPAASSPAAPSPTAEAVTGKWANPTAAITLSSTGGVIKQRSGSVWTGDLDGKTTFNAVLHADPKAAGSLVGTINETFTGSVHDIGQGHLFLSEEITDSKNGGVVVDATVLRGDAGLKGVTGHLHFTGSSDIQGIGDGTYTGSLSH
jgi:uncharacterized protein (DUF2147 family)